MADFYDHMQYGSCAPVSVGDRDQAGTDIDSHGMLFLFVFRHIYHRRQKGESGVKAEISCQITGQ